MAKIKVNCVIKNMSSNEEKKLICDGILNNNKIIYKDKDAICELTIKEKEVFFVKKRFDNVNLKFHFNEEIDTYIDVIGDYSTKIPLLTKLVNIEKGKIEIIYEVDLNEKFLFCLLYE